MNWPNDFMNKIICGDCLEVMKEMPDKSIDMCITSPPYWGLRDYGIGPDQLGLEPTPEMYIEHLTEIFNEVKRVLKKEGTLWLNIGDTYWSAKGSCFNPGGNENALETNKKEMGAYPLNRGNKSDVPNLPQKCLVMIPERLAWSLIQNGWILRNKNIWHKRNAMPSSVTDRFSNTYEFVYMFSKSQRYYFDLDAVREPHATQENRPFGIVRNREWGYDLKENYLRQTKIPEESAESYGSPRARNYREKKTKSEIMHEYNPTYPADRSRGEHPDGKNPGDVFEINTQPFPEAHFAVFPEKLCKKPIKAGCPEDGIVLDPFAGAGTALLVAKEMKRRFIGIDIKQEYCDMCEERLAQGVL